MIIFGRGQRVMPEGEYPGMHIASLTVYGREPFRDAAMVGGSLHRCHAPSCRSVPSPWSCRGRWEDHLINGPMGIMLRDLRLSFSISARRRAFRHWSRGSSMIDRLRGKRDRLPPYATRRAPPVGRGVFVRQEMPAPDDGRSVGLDNRDREGWRMPRLLEGWLSSFGNRASGASRPTCNALQYGRLRHSRKRGAGCAAAW